MTASATVSASGYGPHFRAHHGSVAAWQWHGHDARLRAGRAYGSRSQTVIGTVQGMQAGTGFHHWFQHVLVAYLLCCDSILCTSHGHSARDHAGICFQYEPGPAVISPRHYDSASQAVQHRVFTHPLSMISSIANSARSRFSSTVFFSIAPLQCSQPQCLHGSALSHWSEQKLAKHKGSCYLRSKDTDS